MKVDSKIVFYGSTTLFVRSNEKLPVKASNSLPEFYQEEFPTFQKFIDTYYQFLSRKTPGFKNIQTIKDIDEIGRKYLEAFYSMYAKDMPEYPYIGLADFIRNSKHFYTSRGSEDSFRFLFRIMFGEEIEFKYPKENILIPSSGKWSQPVSIYINVTSGTLDNSIVGKKLLIKGLDGSTSSFLVKSINDLGSGDWEIFVDNFIKQNVVYGAKVFGSRDPISLEYTIKGDVLRTYNTYTVDTPGTEFLPGQVYNHMTAYGKVSFRVTAVDDEGGIKRIEFIEFCNPVPVGTPETVTIRDANISLLTSSVNTYTGYYDNTDGFLSNESKLGDNYYYQIFSYVIKSRVSRELYSNLIDKILHPTGLINFSELERGSEYQISSQEDSTSNTILDMVDVLNTYDEFHRVFTANRSFNDSLVLDDLASFLVQKYFSDTLSMTDQGSVEYWKVSDYAETAYVEPLYSTSQYTKEDF